MIADMESQIASMKNNLAALKRTGKEKHKEKKEKREKRNKYVSIQWSFESE